MILTCDKARGRFKPCYEVHWAFVTYKSGLLCILLSFKGSNIKNKFMFKRKTIVAKQFLFSFFQVHYSMRSCAGKAIILTGQHAPTDTEVQLYQRVLQQQGYRVDQARYAETSASLRQDRRGERGTITSGPFVCKPSLYLEYYCTTYCTVCSTLNAAYI